MLGKITAIGYPGFIKPPLFYLLKGKIGFNSSIFFWYSPMFGMCQKAVISQRICIVSISIKLGPYYISINSKIFFQQRACYYRSHFTTDHFFISFMPNRKYSYIFSAVMSSQSSTGARTDLCKDLSHWAINLNFLFFSPSRNRIIF